MAANVLSLGVDTSRTDASLTATSAKFDKYKKKVDNTATAMDSFQKVIDSQDSILKSNEKLVTAQIRNYDKLDKTLNETTRAIKNFTEAQKRARKSNNDANSSIGGFSSLVTRLAKVYIASRAINYTLDFANSLVRVEVEADRTIRKLSILTGDIKTARQEFLFAAQTANQLGLDLFSVAGEYASFAAAAKSTNLSMTELRSTFTSFSKAAAAIQASGQDTRFIFLALTQMLSKGRVASEELRRQLAERLPGAFQLAAKAVFGTEQATDRLNKALETGAINSEEFIRVFSKTVDATFGEVGVKAGIEGTSSAINRMSNEWDRLLLSFKSTEVVKESAGIIENTFRGLREFFEYVSKNPFDEVVKLSGPDTVLSNLIKNRIELELELSDLTENNVKSANALSSVRRKVVQDELDFTNNLIEKRKEQIRNNRELIKTQREARELAKVRSGSDGDLGSKIDAAQQLISDQKAAQRLVKAYSEVDEKLADTLKNAQRLSKVIDPKTKQPLISQAQLDMIDKVIGDKLVKDAERFATTFINGMNSAGLSLAELNEKAKTLNDSTEESALRAKAVGIALREAAEKEADKLLSKYKDQENQLDRDLRLLDEIKGITGSIANEEEIRAGIAKKRNEDAVESAKSYLQQLRDSNLSLTDIQDKIAKMSKDTGTSAEEAAALNAQFEILTDKSLNKLDRSLGKQLTQFEKMKQTAKELLEVGKLTQEDYDKRIAKIDEAMKKEKGILNIVQEYNALIENTGSALVDAMAEGALGIRKSFSDLFKGILQDYTTYIIRNNVQDFLLGTKNESGQRVGGLLSGFTNALIGNPTPKATNSSIGGLDQPNVKVNINNQNGVQSQVSTSMGVGSNGQKELQFMIDNGVQNALSSGAVDKTMALNYGTRRLPK